MASPRSRRRKRPWERKLPIRSGPPEPMLLDDALDRFDGEWIVFHILRPDDETVNHEGVVVAHGGPEKPMREIAASIWTGQPDVRLVVQYSTGRPIRTGAELRRAIDEYFETHDYDEWYDVWRR